MNDLERSAMEQALEALEAYATHQRLPGPCPVRDAEYALRAALAEPVQEPVAYSVGRTLHWHEGNGVNDAQLYAAPPQRKPATIDEMFDRMDKAPKGVFFGHDPMTIWMEAWRAAEQHHGIT